MAEQQPHHVWQEVKAHRMETRNHAGIAERQLDELLKHVKASHNTAKWILGIFIVTLIVGIYLGIKV